MKLQNARASAEALTTTLENLDSELQESVFQSHYDVKRTDWYTEFVNWRRKSLLIVHRVSHGKNRKRQTRSKIFPSWNPDEAVM
uniref:Uncharacterized protein n=1 Tax=Salix viminalis TaxID=40686 RepID=A0A6N2NEZ1_SALVM